MTDPTCRECGKTLVWAQPYVKGNPPVEADGSKHICSKNNTAASPKAEIPIEQIVAEITAIKATMIVEGQDGLETDKLKVPITSEMIEGIWKYAISRKMGGRN